MWHDHPPTPATSDCCEPKQSSASASSRRALQYPGLITCGGSSEWTHFRSGQSRVSSCAGATAGNAS